MCVIFTNYLLARGWVCNGCSTLRRGARWFCSECEEDRCFNCYPRDQPPATGIDRSVSFSGEMSGSGVGRATSGEGSGIGGVARCSSGLHELSVTNCSTGRYAGGWICNNCESPDTGYRWCCSHCNEDYCFDCIPNTSAIVISSHLLCSSKEHQMIVSDYAVGNYAAGWRCNRCRCRGRGERWWCPACECDYCFECCRAPHK